MQDAQPWTVGRDVLPAPRAPRRPLGRRGVDPAGSGRRRRLGRVLVDMGVPVGSVEFGLSSTAPGRLGERLVAAGSVTSEAVDAALEMQESSLELPLAPTDAERASYLSRGRWIVPFQWLAFAGGAVSLGRVAHESAWLVPLLLAYSFAAVSFVLGINAQVAGRSRFSSEVSDSGWRPSVDVMLPTCGEDLSVLDNTWRHVMGLRWTGAVSAYVLDDAGRPEVAQLAAHYGFTYLARPAHEPDEAGNLLHGVARSSGELIVVFDAGFAPRHDFLLELVPHLADPAVGMVQTPQHFDVSRSQGWVQRGAGAVQELFHRHLQQGRSAVGAPLCVGTNAVYRRSALSAIGGPVPSEHTGFRMTRAGFRTLYVPLVLAKGLCPAGLRSFFHQQYRSCSGSVSLVASRGFWSSRMSLRQRLCFLSGFTSYVHTALWTFLGPLPVLLVLWFFPGLVTVRNYLPLLPAALTTWVLVPLWHRASYPRLAAERVRGVSAYAHLFAVVDRLRGRAGAGRYEAFRRVHAVWSFLVVGGLLSGAGLRLVQGHGPVAFLPLVAYAVLQGYQSVRIRLALREVAPAVEAATAPVVPAPRASSEMGVSWKALPQTAG